jgi:hypothetical protein
MRGCNSFNSALALNFQSVGIRAFGDARDRSPFGQGIRIAERDPPVRRALFRHKWGLRSRWTHPVVVNSGYLEAVLGLRVTQTVRQIIRLTAIVRRR